jgi:hypothetical protein
LNNIATQLENILGGNAVKRFANNVEDAQTITSLVEDIRDALTDYQVRFLKLGLHILIDDGKPPRSLYSRTSMI